MAAIALFVGMPWAVFTGIAKVKAAGRGPGEPAGRNQLRRSELEVMIEDAVDDATAELRRRIETLEAIAIDEERAQDRLDAAVLADALEPDDLEEAPAAARRRTRA